MEENSAQKPRLRPRAGFRTLLLQHHRLLTSCCLIDRLDDRQIAQTLFPRRERLAVCLHTIGHMIHFSGEVVDFWHIVLLDDIAAFDPEAQAAVPSGRVQAQTSLGSKNAIMTLMEVAIAGRAIRQHSAGESQLEAYMFLN